MSARRPLKPGMAKSEMTTSHGRVSEWMSVRRERRIAEHAVLREKRRLGLALRSFRRRR